MPHLCSPPQTTNLPLSDVICTQHRIIAWAVICVPFDSLYWLFVTNWVKVSAFSPENRKVPYLRTYRWPPAFHQHVALACSRFLISIRLWYYFAVIGQRDVRNYIFSVKFVLHHDSRHQSPPFDPHSLAMLTFVASQLDSTGRNFVEWFNNGFVDTHLCSVRRNSLVDALRPDARVAPKHGLQ